MIEVGKKYLFTYSQGGGPQLWFNDVHMEANGQVVEVVGFDEVYPKELIRVKTAAGNTFLVWHGELSEPRFN